VESLLEALWDEGLRPEEYFRRLDETTCNQERRILYSRRRPEWLVGLADDFINSVSSIDKKLQGRVIVAITKITRGPTTIIGDTMKPLSKNLSGLWRYRIGDYRLVYQPDVENKRILLLSFGARGDIYEGERRGDR
jgi:mRNA-degrading endonuclease RelE of RelBE toxin-antitoxin system